jgi:DhnA family fructose-bisphosphate aldolase class Ia
VAGMEAKYSGVTGTNNCGASRMELTMTPERLAEIKLRGKYEFSGGYTMSGKVVLELVAEVERLLSVTAIAKAAVIAFGSDTEGPAIAALGKALAELEDGR